MDETEQQDEVDQRAEDCLAKATYLEWAAATISDGQLRMIYSRLSSEWLQELKK